MPQWDAASKVSYSFLDAPAILDQRRSVRMPTRLLDTAVAQSGQRKPIADVRAGGARKRERARYGPQVYQCARSPVLMVQAELEQFLEQE